MKTFSNNILNSLEKVLFLFSIFIFEFSIYTRNISFILPHSANLQNISLAMLFIISIIALIKLKLNIKQWLIILGIFLIGVISRIITDDSLVLQLSFIIICAWNFKFDDILKWDIIFKIIILIFILFCYNLGFTIINQFSRDGIARLAYGFRQPNTFAYFIFMLYLELIYYIREKNSIWKYYVFSIPVFYFLEKADSRSSEMILILFLILITLNWSKGKIKKFEVKIKKNFNILFYILTFFSIITTLMYINNNESINFINKILSNRLLYQALFWENYKITLFGNEMNYFVTLDNSYIRVILNFGIIAWVIFAFIYNKIIFKAKEKNDSIMVIIIYCILIYGTMEWYMIRPVINIFLLYFSSKVLKKGEENE